MGIFLSITSPSQELEQSAVHKAITDLALKVFQYDRAGHMPSLPKLDITFMLSTEGDAPEFQGMRMGAYAEDSHTLFFEIAIPTTISNSGYAEDYVKALLFDAIDNADDYFTELKLSIFNKDEWLAMATSMMDDNTAPLVSH